MAKKNRKTPTPRQVEARLERAVAKERIDKVIERRTRSELATYYAPGRRLEDRKLLTVAEVASRIGVTERRVRSFITSGRLPAIKLNTLYLVKWSDLMLFDKKPRKSGAPANLEN